MIVHESSYNKYNFFELLIAIQTGRVNVKRNRNLEVDDMQNKYIILYYLGDFSFNPQLDRTSFDQLCVIRESFFNIFRCCGNTDKAFLWWYDDGKLKQLLKSCREQIEAKKIYDEIMGLFRDCEFALHDCSLDLPKAAAKADILYGDNAPFEKSFESSGKPIIRQDLLRESAPGNFALWSEWLSKIIQPKFNREYLTKEWRIQDRDIKIYVCYISTDTLLSYGMNAVNRLNRIISAWICNSKAYCIWLVDRDITVVLNMLHDDCRKKFLALRNKAIASGHCIYDNRYCLQELSEYASGYYGVNSVGVASMLARSKPVVIMNPHGYSGLSPDRVSKRYQGKGVGLQFTGGCWIGDDFYFCSFQTNGLYKYRRGTSEAIFVSHVPVKNIRSVRSALIITIVPYCDKLYCIPTLAEALMIYDLTSGKWSRVALSKKYIGKNKLKFGGVHIIGDCVWMLPLGYSAVVRMDLRSRELTYISTWSKETLPYIKRPLSQYYCGEVRLNNKLYFIANQSPQIIEIDCETMSSRVYEVPGISRGLQSVTTDGNDLWITDNEGTLLCWNPIVGMKNCWDNPLDNGQCCLAVIYHSGSIWMFAYWKDTYIKYDLKCKSFHIIKGYLPEDLKDGLGAASLRSDDKYIYIYPNVGELFVRLSPGNGKIEAKSIRFMPQKFWEYYYSDVDKLVMDESDFIDTNEMLIYMENEEIEQKEKTNSGKNIYDMIIS